jgi:hypothetical protein
MMNSRSAALDKARYGRVIGGGLQKFDAAGRGAEECHAHSFARNVLGSFGFRPEKGRPAADGLFEVGRRDADVIYLGHTYLQ